MLKTACAAGIRVGAQAMPSRSSPPVEYWPSSSTEGLASKSPSLSSGLQARGASESELAAAGKQSAASWAAQ